MRMHTSLRDGADNTTSKCMARWLSWLEHMVHTHGVEGSTPPLATLDDYILWDLSSAGRASALQAEGHRFEPYRSHFPQKVLAK